MIKIFFLYFIFINIIGLLSMYIDKRKAIKHEWRIPENTLMFIAIIGGSIGSLLGMNMFRHKTKHAKFKFGIPLIILIQVILLFFYLTT